MSCKSIGCKNDTEQGDDYCPVCVHRHNNQKESVLQSAMTMAEKYPQYYKNIEEYDELDVYLIHHLFDVNDPSGCIQHSSKKLLLSGVRTGGKSVFKDIEEARDTLTRWLHINKRLEPAT